MTEQQTPHPADEPTADAIESVALTEQGGLPPAPAATQGAPVEQADAEPVEESPSQPDAGADAPSEQAAAPAEAAEEPEAATGPADAPAEQVEAPAEQADTPAEQPEAPAEQPEAPAEQADTPAEQPEAPAEQADAPADQADAPAEQADAPADQADAPAEQADAPAEQPEAPAVQADTEPASAEPGGAIEAEAAEAPAPAPRPTAVPRPRPLPKPSALRKPAAQAPGAAPAPAVVAPVLDDAKEAAAAAAWGRVDPDGTVWVREAAGERTVGQYTGADMDEALAFYVRRFLDLQAQMLLFETRLPQLQTKEIDQTLATLTEALAEPAAVGDLDGLRARVETLRERAAARRKEISAEREAAKAKALEERTAVVERAEAIAAADPASTHWRSSGDELRALLDQWKQAQRSGPRLDRPTEDALWKRFSRARTTFDRNRGHFFSQLDATQSEVKRAKEQLIAEAEALSTSKDWGRTSAAYRDLMDRWKAAGRASRKEDDALWARFRAARQAFYEARENENAQIDAEYAANLEVKLALLEQAEALLPVTDPEAAKAALRPIQDKWDEAGKVPRSDVQRVEGRMRAVEQAVRDADQERWSRSDPEKKARAEGAAAQLYEAIDGLEQQLAQARAAGDPRAEKEAAAALEARKSWLDQILRSTGS
ncbi:protein of unknown function [Georgenia satyanarayanai]|uniref:DUF349 domain-containing protein n=1 Tax=Georgenia satyanarayanai TaxID=860221 RepID=A0A2Y8ZX55_9MICO|nr:DUF349 domain-containing protein [Georgenia satyanarayanai]PYG02090.1 uncharacterized protein DUF349 [Georgenia satyanarayanai]SSA36901.1 protein of unknown function [Georgenia satyanarayanai]